MKKIYSFLTLILSTLIINTHAYALICPETINFTCVDTDSAICPEIAHPTLCTAKNIDPAWRFSAPARPINIFSAKPSCSNLPSGNYTARYGLSCYGKLVQSEGKPYDAAYCVNYMRIEEGIAMSLLISQDYTFDSQQPNWTKVTPDQWICQNAQECNFIKRG